MPQKLSDILSPSKKNTLADEVVVRLRDAISNGDLQPGERLTETELAEVLDVSRGPIREALSQLELEGLVIKQPNRGAFVAKLSDEDLKEVYSLRLALERLAVQQVVVDPDPEYLDQMQAVVDEMADCVETGISEQEAAELDIRFHEILCRAANHGRLYDFWTNLRSQIYIFLLSRNIANPDFRELAVESHQGIVDALRSGSEQRAVAIIDEHLTAAYQRILNERTQKD